MMRYFDRVALTAMVAGTAAMLQPWWPDGFRLGWWVLLAGTVVQTVTARYVAEQ